MLQTEDRRWGKMCVLRIAALGIEWWKRTLQVCIYNIHVHVRVYNFLHVRNYMYAYSMLVSIENQPLRLLNEARRARGDHYLLTYCTCTCMYDALSFLPVIILASSTQRWGRISTTCSRSTCRMYSHDYVHVYVHLYTCTYNIIHITYTVHAHVHPGTCTCMLKLKWDSTMQTPKSQYT